MSGIHPAYADWKGFAEFGLTNRTGNTEETNLTLATGVSHADSTFEFGLSGRTVYAEQNNTKTAQEYNANLTFDYLPVSRISPFVLMTIYKNKFRAIDWRINAGIGAKYTFYRRYHPEHGGTDQLSTTLVGLYESERYTSGVDDKTDRLLKSRPKFIHHIGSQVVFKCITFFTVSTTRDRYRINSTTSLAATIYKNLALKTSFQYEFDSAPEPGVNKRDTTLISGLTVKF